jgi:hypothetical protein
LVLLITKLRHDDTRSTKHTKNVCEQNKESYECFSTLLAINTEKNE